MIPSKSDGRWAKLVSGELKVQFNVLSAGLLISRMQRETKAAPDYITQRRCVDEVYAFFQKFEGILQEDIAKIFGQEG